MIITKNDIDSFELALESVVRRSRPYLNNLYGTYYEGREAEHEFNRWLGENPQVLMAGAHLQEFVAAHTLPLYLRMVNEGLILASKQAAFRPYNGRWLITSCRAKEAMWSFSLDTLQQALDQDDETVDRLIDSALIELPRAEDIINNAYKCLGNESLDPTTLVSPRLWTPMAQEEEKRLLQNAALPIIQAIQAEQCELGSLHWRQLEDIVAEILSKSGLEIHTVRSAPQGGRDIVARAKLAGEVITIAVEVKHRDVVDRPALHTALHQNAQFPALMLVTSGRFTAGVLREAKRPQNKLRLFLKDGVALGDLIRCYMPESNKSLRRRAARVLEPQL